MLMTLIFFGLIVWGLVVLWRGLPTSPNVQPVRSIGELDTFTRTGTVIDQQSRVETTVRTTTTGGSTLLMDGVGTRSAPTTSIASSSIEFIRLFLRDEQGAEFDVEIENPGFGIRPGHVVTILYAGNRRSQKYHPMAVANRTTNQCAVLHNRIEWLLIRRSTTLGCVALVVIPFLAMVVGGIFLDLLLGQDPRGHMGGRTSLGGLAFLVVVCALGLGWRRKERLKSEINAALQSEL
jgi:hypothetical protein